MKPRIGTQAVPLRRDGEIHKTGFMAVDRPHQMLHGCIQVSQLAVKQSQSSLMDEARRGAAQRQAAAETKHFVASFDKEDIRVVVHGDTAVTSYRFIVTIQNDGQETRRRYRTTNVWIKRQPGWQVMAGHTASLDAMLP